MLRIEDSTAWASHISELASQITAQRQLALRSPGTPERLVASLQQRLPNAIYVHIPPSVDKVERVLLGMAQALGPEHLIEVDQRLRKHPDNLAPLLRLLDMGLAGRPLLVHGWSWLGGGESNSDLGHAMGPVLHAVKGWLGRQRGLFLCQSAPPKGVSAGPPLKEAPVQLVNGGVQDTQKLWKQLGAEDYPLALACLVMGRAQSEVKERSTDDLRALLVTDLPREVTRTLRNLSLHGRPLSPRLLPNQPTARTLALGRDLGLWSEVSGELLVGSGWRDFVGRTLVPERQREGHLELAREFLAQFRLGQDPTPDTYLSILEAHRHLVLAGDLEQAKTCWRYSAALLLEAAQKRSLSGHFDEAAGLYAAVLSAADSQRVPLSKQLRGYTVHYLHFNRARAGSEDLSATERGYQDAVNHWPDNALFWSRLVRVLCLQDRFGAAQETLRKAERVVPEHPQKGVLLKARTVRGLLDHKRPVDALRIWGDFQPDTLPAREVERRLIDELAKGWTTSSLDLQPDAPLVFLRPVTVQIVRGHDRFTAELLNLYVSGTGPTPELALRALVVSTRDEVKQLMRAHTSDLNPTHRLRKRMLLGAVDVLASRLSAAPLDSYWYLGTLHRENNTLWLRTGGSQDLWFEVPPSLSVTLDDLTHLARVAADALGVPVGPVLEIRPGYRGTDEKLWQQWREMLANAD